ncbi:MAG: hypothetical protein AABX29_09410 [Nanoarchaeota archaeon]
METLIPKQTEQETKTASLRNSIIRNRCIAESVSLLGINPDTPLNPSTPLLIGIGTGGRELSQGLPLDVLTMILTAEQLRRDVGLGNCYIVCDNEAAIANLGEKTGFTETNINRIAQANRELIKIVLDQLGISDHFSVFLGSDLQQIIGDESRDAFIEIKDQIKSKYEVGDYFAIETAQMYSLIGSGGVKIGWFNKRTSLKDKGFILDELPFDSFYMRYCEQEGLRNNASFIYVNAGVNLKPGHNDQVVKESPYACYDPKSRVLLRPDEDAEKKLSDIDKYQNTPAKVSIRKYFHNFVRQFEDVTGLDCRPKGTSTAQRVQLILDYLFAGRELESRSILSRGFET